MGSNIHLIDCSQKTLVYDFMLKVLFLSKIYSVCHMPGSSSIMTDKHTAEHSKTACLGINWPVCDVFIAHTTI